MEKKQTHLAYGIIAGVLMVVVALIIHVTGASFVKGVSYITYIPLLVCIIMNANAFSKANNAFVTYGNVFTSGLKATLVASVIMVIWGVVCIFVFPEMKDKAIEMARAEAAKNPMATDDSIELAVKIIDKGWNYFLIFGALLGTFVMGLIFSLIAGATANKKGELEITADNF